MRDASQIQDRRDGGAQPVMKPDGRLQPAEVAGTRKPGRPADVAPASQPAAITDIVGRLGVQYRTAVDLAYAVMREAILTGELLPGEKVNQDVIARGIGVSREPIRSAIRQLAADGLVVVLPHRGAVVSSLSHAQLREILGLRTLLEPYAVRLGIATMTPARLERLNELAGQLDQTPRSPASGRLLLQYYEVLYDAPNNPLVVELIERLRRDVARYWYHRKRFSEYDHGHRPLLEFAMQGDPEGAAKWLASHLEEVGAYYLESDLMHEEHDGSEMHG